MKYKNAKKPEKFLNFDSAKKTNNYICTNRSPDYKIEVDKILESKKKEILDFFEVNENSKDFTFNVYIYDTILDLVKGLKGRGFDEIPNYVCACMKDEDKSLNFFEPKDECTENDWSKSDYEQVIFHEEIHGIQYCIYGKQAEWLTEGVAKYLDGQYSKGIKYLLENYVNNYKLPDISMLKGDTFVTDNYDGYDLSYLMVSYLIETMGKAKFLKIISDKDKSNAIGINLAEKAVSYYNYKFKIDKTI